MTGGHGRCGWNEVAHGWLGSIENRAGGPNSVFGGKRQSVQVVEAGFVGRAPLKQPAMWEWSASEVRVVSSAKGT